MIDEAISEQSSVFQEVWNQRFAKYPAYQLDGEWPSIGVLDLLLWSLRGKSSLEESEEVLLRGAGAYIAEFIYRCWSAYPGDYTVRLTEKTRPEFDYLLEINGEGALCSEDARPRILLYSALKRMLREQRNPLQHYQQFSLPHSANSNLLSPYVAGICAFASPDMQGSSISLALEKQFERETPSCEFITRSIVRSFSRLYPHEDILNESSFFYPGLALPPDYVDGGPPLLRPTASTFTMLEQLTEEKHYERIARALARSTDDLIAKVGYTIVASLQRMAPQKEIAVLAESRDIRALQSRASVVHLRHLQGIEGDWLRLVDLGEVKAAQRMLDLDVLLGLAPTVCFPLISHIGDPLYRPLLQMLSSGSHTLAAEVLRVEERLKYYPCALLLQYAVFAHQVSDYELLERLLLEAKSKHDSKDIESHFTLLRLQGELELAMGAPEKATVHWLRALEVETQNTAKFNELLLRVTQFLALQGTLAPLHEKWFQESATSSFHGMIAKLLRMQFEEDMQEFESTLFSLYIAAPNHPQVFDLVRAHLASETTTSQ